jgi:hypothetical protein
VLEGQEELERFFVNNNGLSSAATHAIVEILTFRTPTKLRVLHFFNNMSGEPRRSPHRQCITWRRSGERNLGIVQR